MEKIGSNIHRDVYEVQEKCGIETFARRHNPVYRSTSGYGYFEFTKLESLKPHKNVIVMDKVCIKTPITTLNSTKFNYTAKQTIHRSWSKILIYRMYI